MSWAARHLDLIGAAVIFGLLLIVQALDDTRRDRSHREHTRGRRDGVRL